MTVEDKYLRKLVEEIIPVYQQFPSSVCIALSGSAAVGNTDRYSDIDLLVYYDVLPEQSVIEELRLHVSGYTPGAYHAVMPGIGIVEYFYLHGVRCDIAHIALDHWVSLLDDVVEKGDSEFAKQKAVGGILKAIALYDEHHYLQRWQEKAARYPDELRRTMVRDHLVFYPAWIMQFMAAWRGDMVWYRDLLLQAVKNMLAVLMGLNRIYHQMDFKHLQSIIGSMTIAPPHTAERIESFFYLPPAEAVPQLMNFITEVVDLIEVHLPDVDVSRVRARLAVEYAGWDIPPEFSKS